MALSFRSREGLMRINAINFFKRTQRHVATFCLDDLVNLQDVLVNPTAAAFSGCNLSSIAPQARGRILEDVGRKIYQRRYPNSNITDPVPGYRCDGARRGQKQAEFDWMCDRTRVQCKSGQLRRDQKANAWCCTFYNIKPEMLDELLLVFYTPKKLHFVCHDGHSGLSSTGAKTASRGYRLDYVAPASMACPELATSCILQRMQQQSCRIIDSLCTSSQLVLEEFNSVSGSQKHRLERSAFEHHPLRGINPTRRGLIIQDIVQKVDQRHHNILTSTEPRTSQFDWRRQDLRVECKHTRMAWCSHKKMWVCAVFAVKIDNFDVLYLALDTPAGIHILNFHGPKYVHSTGACEESIGKAIQIYGPKHETSWSVALDDIMNKLTKSGSEHIATVKW